MIIYVPFTYVHAPTWESAIRSVMRVVRLDPTMEDDYLRYFEDRWDEGGSFANCEHDVVPTPLQVLELLYCKEAHWCAFSEYEGGPPSLSFVRFDAEFIADNPDIWKELRAGRHHGQPVWTLLDSWLVAHADRPPHVHVGIRNDRPRWSVPCPALASSVPTTNSRTSEACSGRSA